MQVKIPVGDAPNWEEKVENEEGLEDTSQSAAIHYSLRQSRNTWLHNVFPKFSHKSRKASQPEIKQPHELRFIAKCDIELGPHTFKDCSFYEAVYTPQQPVANTVPMSYSGPSNYLQTPHGQHTPYPMSGFNHYVPPTPLSTELPHVPPTPPDTSNEMIEVTPALLAQVNEAAATNPTVANLLQATAANVATNEQMRFLGLFIQSLALQAKQRAASANLFKHPMPSTSQQAFNHPLPQPAKRSDLILEFRENYNDRFIVPREISACETETMAPGRADIVMYTLVPFKRTTGETNDKPEAEGKSTEKSPLVMRLLNVPPVLSLLVRAWVNEDAKIEGAWDKFYDKSQACKPRVYPQFKFPKGDLLTQLQNACDNGYTMKSIKPPPASDTTASRRSRQRKSSQNRSRSSPSIPQPIASMKDAANSADAHMALLAAVTRSSPETSSPVEILKKKRMSKKKQNQFRNEPRGLFFVNTTSGPSPMYPQQQQINPTYQVASGSVLSPSTSSAPLTPTVTTPMPTTVTTTVVTNDIPAPMEGVQPAPLQTS